MSFRQQAVEPAKPVGLVLSCFLGYGPQGGLPALLRRSYGAGFLCRLRRHVGPLAQFGPTCAGLPLATMDRSESLLSIRALFLSLSAPSLPVPVVGAEGVCRASQFPVGAFFACHALGPRQVSRNLTFVGLLHVGFRVTQPRSHLRLFRRFEAGLL